ncbi:MAG: hypothetical protein ACRDG2_04970 [Actinomycetota bacterium]
MSVGRDSITEDELANRAGASVETIRRLVRLGILSLEDGAFRRRDVMRVREVRGLEDKGIDPETLAAALGSGHLTLGYLESAGRRFPRSDVTFERLAVDAGVALERSSGFMSRSDSRGPSRTNASRSKISRC